jgi:hypothetical protein
MAEYLTDPQTPGRIAEMCLAFTHRKAAAQVAKHVDRSSGRPTLKTWPIPNVWWGFSAGRQKTFDEAMPYIVAIERHTAIRWWSAEPLLEAIDCSPAKTWVRGSGGDYQQGRGTNTTWKPGCRTCPGWWSAANPRTGCRAMDPDWARAIKARCDGRTDMGRPWALPFHMKQLGGDPNPRKKLEDLPPDLRVRDYPRTAAAA